MQLNNLVGVVKGSITNKCDQTIRFDKIAIFLNGEQISFCFGQALKPGEIMGITETVIPPAYTKNSTLEIKVVGFRKIY